MTDYALLTEQITALTADCPWALANLANAAAALYWSMAGINWAGFYLLRQGKLVLGPFQGKTACTVIEPERGVCGAAFRQDRVMNVPDVHQFPGHIACDSASNSELVIPLHDGAGKRVAVLDIDSTGYSRFSPEDEEGLTRLARELEKRIRWEDLNCGD